MERREYEPLTERSRGDGVSEQENAYGSDDDSDSDRERGGLGNIDGAPVRGEPGRYMTVIEVEMKKFAKAEFNRWFDEEHIPLLARVPGWVRSRRFVLQFTRALGAETALVDKYGEGKVAKYLAIHEYADAHAGDTDEFKAALNTPWAKAILGKVSRFEKRIWKLSKSWERS